MRTWGALSISLYLPGEYTYTYTVADDAGNAATQDVIIQVALRSFVLVKDVKIGTVGRCR